MNWNDGYVQDIRYTSGHYAELNPVQARLALLNAGWHCPTVSTACELGFGNGLSVNLHAAAGPAATWWGNDFLPGQVGFAQELAQATASPGLLNLCDDSFAEFEARTDLPAFDFVALHGIWSWVSLANRGRIVELLRRRLKVGGVVYLSYNAMAGWAPLVPVQQLLAQVAQRLCPPSSGSLAQFQAGLQFFRQLLQTQPGYLKVNPHLNKWLEGAAEQNPVYLAHEYLNQHWHPMHFADVAAELAPAKLDFACSATLHEHILPLHLTPEQVQLLEATPDLVMRETLRDWMLNQFFRRDYWVKGARPLSAAARLKALRQLRVVLLTPAAQVPLSVKTRLGEAELSEAVYRPLLAQLATHQPQSLGALENTFSGKPGLGLDEIVQAVLVLVGQHQVAVAQDEAQVNAARPRTERLNAHLLELASQGSGVDFLASPLTGGGVPLHRVEQLMLLAHQRGLKSPEEKARFVWHLWHQGGGPSVPLSRKGQVLATESENLAELRAQATAFATIGLNRLAGLQLL